MQTESEYGMLVSHDKQSAEENRTQKRMTKSQTRALIVTQRESLQNGLQALVMSIPQVDIIDQVDNGARALQIIQEHHPDLVLLDTNLPNDEEWQMLERIKTLWPEIRCVVLADDVGQQREAMTLGADLVLLKGFPPAKLAETIETIAATENTEPRPFVAQ
jgi:two-component system response regulator DegU